MHSLSFSDKFIKMKCKTLETRILDIHTLKGCMSNILCIQSQLHECFYKFLCSVVTTTFLHVNHFLLLFLINVKTRNKKAQEMKLDMKVPVKIKCMHAHTCTHMLFMKTTCFWKGVQSVNAS